MWMCILRIHCTDVYIDTHDLYVYLSLRHEVRTKIESQPELHWVLKIYVESEVKIKP